MKLKGSRDECNVRVFGESIWGEGEAMRRGARRSHRTCVLDSSLLAVMTYSDRATLDLVFRNGAVYRYFAVPARVVAGLRTAPSPGAYFHHQIRKRFRYQRIT